MDRSALDAARGVSLAATIAPETRSRALLVRALSVAGAMATASIVVLLPAIGAAIAKAIDPSLPIVSGAASLPEFFFTGLACALIGLVVVAVEAVALERRIGAPLATAIAGAIGTIGIVGAGLEIVCARGVAEGGPSTGLTWVNNALAKIPDFVANEPFGVFAKIAVPFAIPFAILALVRRRRVVPAIEAGALLIGTIVLEVGLFFVPPYDLSPSPTSHVEAAIPGIVSILLAAVLALACLVCSKLEPRARRLVARWEHRA